MCALDAVALEVFSVSYCLLIYSASIYLLNTYDNRFCSQLLRHICKTMMWSSETLRHTQVFFFFFVEVNHID